MSRNSERKETLSGLLLDELNNWDMHSKSYGLAQAFWRLFKIAEMERDLDAVLIQYYHYWKGTGECKPEEIEYYKEQWAFVFLKSIRQCDFFQYAKLIIPDSQLTKEDTIRRAELIGLRRKKMKEALGDIRKASGAEIEAFDKQFDIDYKTELNELYKLNGKLYHTKEESICGHLDMLLHTLINYDQKNVLERSLITAFEEFELVEKRKARLQKEGTKN